MSTAWILRILLSFQLPADAPNTTQSPGNENPQQAIQEEIDRSIRALDSDSFRARENATEQIWRFAEQAKPALRQVIEQGSLEARSRAASILADIELGITPETTPEQIRLLRQFQASSKPRRAALLWELLKAGDIDRVTKLIDHIEDNETKRDFIRKAHKEASFISGLILSNRWSTWTQKASNIDSNIHRHDIVIDWIANRNGLTVLDNHTRRKIAESLLTQEPNAGDRYLLAKKLLECHAFRIHFGDYENLGFLMNLVEFPLDVDASNKMLAILIQSADASTICQPASVEKIMRALAARTSSDSARKAKLALLSKLAFSGSTPNTLIADSFTQICEEATTTELRNLLDESTKSTAITNWAIDGRNCQQLLEWINGLPDPKKEVFIEYLGSLFESNQNAASRLLNHPPAFQLYWILIESSGPENKRQALKVSLVPYLNENFYTNGQHREDVARIILSTHTPQSDAAFITMLRNNQYREQTLTSDENMKAYFARCDHIDVTQGTQTLEEAYQKLFNTQSLPSQFSDTTSARWLIQDYLTKLPNQRRGIAIREIAQSIGLLKHLHGRPEFTQLLQLAIELEEPIIRATAIALILQHEVILGLPEDDPRIQLLEIYRDNAIDEKARLAFIHLQLSKPTYLNWLTASGRMNAFLDSANELANKSRNDPEPLIFSRTYVNLIARQNRLDSWLVGFDGDIEAESQALLLLKREDLLTTEFLDRNMPRLLRIARHFKTATPAQKQKKNTDPFELDDTLVISDLPPTQNETAELYASILLSPQSLPIHQRNKSFANLFKEIGREENILIQDHLLHSLSTLHAMEAIAESNEFDSLVEMITSLPPERSRAALWTITQPAMLRHLVDTGKVDCLFELISQNPQWSGLSHNTIAVDILINHGYVDRLLESTGHTNGLDFLAARLAGSSTAIKYYTNNGRVNELVRVFEQLKPGMHRDEAFRTLFSNSEAVISLFREHGVDRTMELVDGIQFRAFMTSARSDALMALADLETLSEPRLRQFLDAIQQENYLGPQEQEILIQRSIGAQLVAAGLLPEIKEIFKRSRRPVGERPSKAFDSVYWSWTVIGHLHQSDQMDEYFLHARSITDSNEIYQFARRSIEHQQGCRALLSPNFLHNFVAIVERMSEYSQGQFWKSLCTNQHVLNHLAESEDSDQLLSFLSNRGKTSIEKLITQIAQSPSLDRFFRNRKLVDWIAKTLPTLGSNSRLDFATRLSQDSSALWMIIETDQWESLVAIIESVEDKRLQRNYWHVCAAERGGLLNSLISLGRTDKIDEVLSKSMESDWHRAWFDLWLRKSQGTIDLAITKAESNSANLSEGNWSWLSWARRAQGEYTKAREAAIKSNRNSFLTSIMIEQDDWKAVVDLLEKSAAPHDYIKPAGGDESELEHQAMLMVASLFLQQTDQAFGFSEAITKLRSESDDLSFQSRCCDVLLLGNQFDSALSFLDQIRKNRAIRFRLQQGKYSEAIELTQWDPADPAASVARIRSFATSTRSATESIVDLLRALKHFQRDDEMRLLHQTVIDSQPVIPNAFRKTHQINQELMHYARLLYQHELYNLFWETLDHIDAPAPILTTTLFSETQDDVVRLLQSSLLQLTNRTESRKYGFTGQQATTETLRIVDKALRTNSIPKTQLDAWVNLVTESSTVKANLASTAVAVGIFCLRHGRLGDARRILVPLEDRHWAASLALARDAWKRQDWDQAAVHYDRLYRSSKARTEGLYFSGLAIARSGKTVEGNATMVKAVKEAYHPRTILQMGIESLEIGEQEIGKDFLQTAFRLSLPHDPLQMEAIKHLKACARSPEETIKWNQQWQMLRTRFYYWHVNQDDLLDSPWALQGALAEQAFGLKDWPAVERALGLCFEIKPGETAFFSQWVGRLEMAEQFTLANALKAKLIAYEPPTREKSEN